MTDPYLTAVAIVEAFQRESEHDFHHLVDGLTDTEDRRHVIAALADICLTELEANRGDTVACYLSTMRTGLLELGET